MTLLPASPHGPARVKPLDGDPLGYHPNRDEIAETALDIADRIRDEDPQAVADQLCAMAWARPGLAAQTILTLAAWLPIEVMTPAALAAQAEQVAKGRTA